MKWKYTLHSNQEDNERGFAFIITNRAFGLFFWKWGFLWESIEGNK